MITEVHNMAYKLIYFLNSEKYWILLEKQNGSRIIEEIIE
jgi:hypothetical protein